MTPRQRVVDAVRHRETDRVPLQIDLTTAAHARLTSYTGDPGWLDRNGNHITYGGYDMIVGETQPGAGFWLDDLGVLWDRRKDDAGIVRNRVLPAPTLAGFLPGAPDAGRLRRDLERSLASAGDLCRVADAGWGLYERGWTLRGMENLLADMIEHPAFVEALFETLCEREMRVLDVVLEYPYDMVLFGDDWGSQAGLMMGRNHWQRFLRPCFARLFERVKTAGRLVALHSCGDIQALFPDLIEMGLDVYQTFQPEVYDIHAVKREYGRDLAFWGGISTQRTLPFGTPEEVRREARETVRVMGKGGGFIAAPTHAVPGDVPPENLVALVETLAASSASG
jgi:uroporphyrinogen decarboxylase